MRMRRLVLTVMIFSAVAMSMTAKSKDTKPKWAENKFQFGIGGTMSTGHLLGIIETGKMIEAENRKNTDYEYPGMTDEQVRAYNDLSKNMKTAIWVSNIFASLEYALQARILWKALIVHADLGFVPMESSYNGRFDMVMGVNAGIRAPFFIMPYITGGFNFTYSFYPDNVVNIDTEKWKVEAGYGVVGNFVFRPGMNFVAGLELKLGKFSIGGYYKYIIKDFSEFKYMYNEFANDPDRKEAAAGLVFSSQSRFGIAVTFYF